MENIYKLHVKLGTAEFQAEGDKDAVREQFAAFLAALNGHARNVSADATDATESSLGGVPDSAVETPQAPKEPTPTLYGLESPLLERIFATDRTGLVSLRILPRTGENRDVDALLYLLYGFAVLKQQHDVISGQLLQAARQSGIQIDRVDQVLNRRADLVTKAGYKRGSRYGLNNRGTTYAAAGVMQLLN